MDNNGSHLAHSHIQDEDVGEDANHSVTLCVSSLGVKSDLTCLGYLFV